MALTSPSDLFSPDAGDGYALVTDLAAMQDSVQAALVIQANYGAGTTTARNANLATFPDGAKWYDTTLSEEYRRIAGAWVSAFDPATYTYTPALTASTTNPSLGSGGNFLQEGKYRYLPGGEVEARVRLRFGTTGATAGSGPYAVSLPVAADTSYYTITPDSTLGGPIGIAALNDNTNAPAATNCVVELNNSTGVRFVSVGSGLLRLSENNLWTWGASDIITFIVRYKHA